GELAVELAREVVVSVPLRRVRLDLRFGEVAGESLDLLLILSEVEVHSGRKGSSGGCEVPADRLQLLLGRDEGVDDGWVELALALTQDLASRRRPTHGPPVRPVARHRVEGVGDGEEPGAERDRVGAQAVRIAASVPALVMRADDLEAFALEERDAR